MLKSEDIKIELKLRKLKPAKTYTLKFLTKGLSNETYDTSPIIGTDAIKLLQSWLDELDNVFHYSHIGLTIKELAYEFNVSSRTIRTWMAVGLVSRTVYAGKFKYRIFTRENIDVFQEENKVRINKSNRKKQISFSDKLTILHQYDSLLNSGLGRYQSIQIISKNLDISDRAIDKIVPDNPVNFSKAVAESKLNSLDLVAKKHKISVSKLKRIIFKAELDYIESFDLTYRDIPHKRDMSVPCKIEKQYVKFSKEQEFNAFSVYNHLKKLASQEKKHKKTLKLLSEVQDVKGKILQSIMPTIITAAESFLKNNSQANEDCLISEGSSVAVKAIDLFDPSFGRFSTYVYGSVIKQWVRSINKQSETEVTNCNFSGYIDEKSTIPDIMEYVSLLSDTEQFIVVSKFALNGGKQMSHKEIADSLGTNAEQVDALWKSISRYIKELYDRD